MEGNWDFYFCNVDENIASIYLDLSYQSVAPIATKSFIAYVRVRLQNPQADGLSSDEDFAALSALEDALAQSVGTSLGAEYVGRNTCNGCRDFYFYVSNDAEWSGAVKAAIAAFDFQFQSGARADPDWDTYCNFLYPSDRDLRRMANRDTCDVFQSKGDQLNSEREIDHWIYFETEQAMRSFLARAKAKGFRVRLRGEPNDDQNRYWVQLFRVDLLSRDNIDALCLELLDLANDVGGVYDGWEAPVHA